MTREISRLFPVVCPKGPQLSQNIRRAGAAEGSEAQLPASRSRKTPSSLPQSRTLVPRYGNYDELLISGYECSEARAEIHDEVDRVLDRWRNPL